MDKISKYTRGAFRDYLVGYSLREISDLFDAADIPRGIPAATYSSARRSLVEEYYGGVEWSFVSDVRKVLTVYEHILGSLEEQVAELPRREFRKLTNLLRRDGYVFEHGRLAPVGGLDLKALAEPPSGVDRATLADHLRRIQQSVDSDPAQAIGSAKELVESVAKSVLASFGQDNDKDETLPQLVKRGIKSLDLSIEDLPEAKKGADSIRKVLAGLGQIVSGTAELRNLYGTGHGRLRTGGLQPRHARLVVGAADTFVRFLLDTLEVRQHLRR